MRRRSRSSLTMAAAHARAGGRALEEAARQQIEEARAAKSAAEQTTSALAATVQSKDDAIRQKRQVAQQLRERLADVEKKVLVGHKMMDEAKLQQQQLERTKLEVRDTQVRALLPPHARSDGGLSCAHGRAGMCQLKLERAKRLKEQKEELQTTAMEKFSTQDKVRVYGAAASAPEGCAPRCGAGAGNGDKEA